MSRIASRCIALTALTALMLALATTSASAAPPVGDFTVSPNPPNQGQIATFTCEPCPAGALVKWDFDGNLDFMEAEGTPATHTFAEAGPVTVTMRLHQDGKGDTLVPHPFTVNAPPVVDFEFAPDSPLPTDQVLFSVTSNSEPLAALKWDFGDGSPPSSQAGPRHTYASPGTYAVKLTATDGGGLEGTKTREITVRDPSGPTAAFSFSPAVPLVGELVTFTDESVASAGSITSTEWDLDNDGAFDDSPAGWSFAAPGGHAVWLRVTQTGGNQAVKRLNIRVNAPPTAAFIWSPVNPVAGQQADLISFSSDPEGALAAQAWDLDGDGQFDDGNGATVRHVFPRAGTHVVGIQVKDSDGVVRSVRQAMTVVRPGFITPFPVVRLSGRVLPHGARVRLLAVRAPRGTLVRVRCAGKGCPVRSARSTSTGRTLRFRKFERRLPAGVRLEIFVRKSQMIGKYTRFLVRAGAPPRRTDRCLFPGIERPRACP